MNMSSVSYTSAYQWYICCPDFWRWCSPFSHDMFNENDNIKHKRGNENPFPNHDNIRKLRSEFYGIWRVSFNMICLTKMKHLMWNNMTSTVSIELFLQKKSGHHRSIEKACCFYTIMQHHTLFQSLRKCLRLETSFVRYNNRKRIHPYIYIYIYIYIFF